MVEYCSDGRTRNITYKRKNKSVFVSMNNLAREHLIEKIDNKELKLQKLNFVYDLKHGKVIFILMKDPTHSQKYKGIQECFN